MEGAFVSSPNARRTAIYSSRDALAVSGYDSDENSTSGDAAWSSLLDETDNFDAIDSSRRHPTGKPLHEPCTEVSSRDPRLEAAHDKVPVQTRSKRGKPEMAQTSALQDEALQSPGPGPATTIGEYATHDRRKDRQHRGPSSSYERRGGSGWRPTSSQSSERESILKYRPSDLDMADMRRNLSRDSLSAYSTASSGTPPQSQSHSQRMQSEDGLSDFIRAAKEGDIALLRECLHDRDLDVTQRDRVHGQTALHLAVRFGHFAIVRLLCQTNRVGEQLVNAKDARQNSALHLAAARSRRMTKFLLEHADADARMVNARGQTALAVHLLTTKRDDPFTVEMLLQYGADPNAVVNCASLIHTAVHRKLIEIACRLVRYGARLDLKDGHGEMVFDKVQGRMLQLLLNKISFPPVWVPNEDRSHCMICERQFNKLRIGIRRHHCRHCGRLCCGACASDWVDLDAFPTTFRTQRMAASSTRRHPHIEEKQRICETCNSVFHERERPHQEKKMIKNFMEKVVGHSWEEVPASKSSWRGSMAPTA